MPLRLVMHKKKHAHTAKRVGWSNAADVTFTPAKPKRYSMGWSDPRDVTFAPGKRRTIRKAATPGLAPTRDHKPQTHPDFPEYAPAKYKHHDAEAYAKILEHHPEGEMALRQYKGYGYQHLNAYERHGEDEARKLIDTNYTGTKHEHMHEKLHQHAFDIKRAMNMHRIPESHTFYRGVHGQLASNFHEAHQRGDLEGGVIHDKAPISVSGRYHVAHEFAHEPPKGIDTTAHPHTAIMHIHTPAGTRGLHLDAVSGNGSEHEFLLAHNRKIQIHHVEHSINPRGGHHYEIHAHVFNPEDSAS